LKGIWKKEPKPRAPTSAKTRQNILRKKYRGRREAPRQLMIPLGTSKKRTERRKRYKGAIWTKKRKKNVLKQTGPGGLRGSKTQREDGPIKGRNSGRPPAGHYFNQQEKKGRKRELRTED